MRERTFDGHRESRGVLLPLAILIFAGIMGNLVGWGLAVVVPGGVVHDLLISGFRFGIDPPWTLNLAVVSMSLGFTLNLTFLGALAMVFVLLLYKKV
jgi:hypothetical protein